MSRPDPNAKPAVERIPNPEPLSGREVLEEKHPHVAAKYRDEEILAAYSHSLHDARTDKISRYKLEQADLNLAYRSYEQSQKPSEKARERLDKRGAALKADWAAYEVSHERTMASTPGSTKNHLDKFFNSPAAHLPYIDANTPTDIREGESPLTANGRIHAQIRAFQEDQKVVTRAQVPAVEVAAGAYALVARLAEKAPLAPIIGSLRGGFSFDDERGRFNRRQPSLPTDAAGLVGLIAALMPDELAGALALKALEGHDESKALDDLERIQKMEAISARMLELQYSAEANHRFARARGESAGLRISGNPLAILDLKPA